jgi:hypothetical protein
MPAAMRLFPTMNSYSSVSRLTVDDHRSFSPARPSIILLARTIFFLQFSRSKISFSALSVSSYCSLCRAARLSIMALTLARFSARFAYTTANFSPITLAYSLKGFTILRVSWYFSMAVIQIPTGARAWDTFEILSGSISGSDIKGLTF